jgi:hypothetical protein
MVALSRGLKCTAHPAVGGTLLAIRGAPYPRTPSELLKPLLIKSQKKEENPFNWILPAILDIILILKFFEA